MMQLRNCVFVDLWLNTVPSSVLPLPPSTVGLTYGSVRGFFRAANCCTASVGPLVVSLLTLATRTD